MRTMLALIATAVLGLGSLDLTAGRAQAQVFRNRAYYNSYYYPYYRYSGYYYNPYNYYYPVTVPSYTYSYGYTGHYFSSYTVPLQGVGVTVPYTTPYGYVWPGYSSSYFYYP